jgi:hypothetical protein
VFETAAEGFMHGNKAISCCIALQADRAKSRLQFLLKQADIFQHFAPTSAKGAAKDTKKWVSPVVKF